MKKILLIEDDENEIETYKSRVEVYNEEKKKVL